MNIKNLGIAAVLGFNTLAGCSDNYQVKTEAEAPVRGRLDTDTFLNRMLQNREAVTRFDYEKPRLTYLRPRNDGEFEKITYEIRR